MRTRVKFLSWGKRLVLAPAFAAALLGASCSNDAADQNKSNSLLTVTAVVTHAGGGQGNEDSAFLLSDVNRVKDPAGVFNDNAIVTIRNTPKNPLLGTTGQYGDVSLQRYTVTYYRSDGRNTQGVDVPYAFQGALAGTIPTGTDADVAFVLVRHQAKEEPPLSRLVGGGGADIVTCFADIVIYGSTLSGQVVTVQTTVNITFADFGDS